jgi:hypothetical protein
MKIEIKNLKHSEFASHETNCFEASVYVDGKRIGVVANDGQGGCNGYTPHTAWEIINEYAKTLPTSKYKMTVRDENGAITQNEIDITPDADTVIDDLVTNALYARDLKRAMSSRIMFINADGDLMETTKMDKVTMAQWLSKPELMDKLKATKVLNLMPMADAIKLYRKQGAN